MVTYPYPIKFSKNTILIHINRGIAINVKKMQSSKDFKEQSLSKVDDENFIN